MEVKDSIAFVTGASRGIGRQLVLALLEAGAAKVYAATRAVSSQDEWSRYSARVVPVELDVTKLLQIERAARTASDADLLINNAAVLEVSEVTALTVETARRHFDVNLWGPFQTTAAFMGHSRSGQLQAVVNILSLIAVRNAPAMAAYSASKAAAWSFTQSFRESLRPRGVAVHAVFPGAVDTDMLATVHMQKASPVSVARAIVAGISSGQEDIFPDAQSMHWFARVRQASIQ